MLKGSKRIAITTEAVNRFKFWVLTAGIDLRQYLKNPLLLFMHNPTTRESLPIGHMTDLQVESDGSITGIPEFDDEDEFAVKLYKKFEKGIIKMASAGLIPVEWSDAPEFIKEGQELPTLVRSILDEVSLCDRGANNEALTLTDENGKRIELSISGENAAIPKLKTKIENNMKVIELKNPTGLLAMLCLSADADETSILAAVQKMNDEKVKLSASVADLQNQLDTKAKELQKVELAAKTTKIEALVQGAVDARKITADEKAAYVSLAATNYESVEDLLSKKAPVPTAQTLLTSDGKNRVAELVKLSFSELHKNGGLEELKRLDPEAYKKKIKE